MKKSCGCGQAPRLIFPCSGASDVGRLSDLAARQMTKDKAGKMYCLAGIGGRVNDILVNARAADSILAIDGCKLDCAKNCLEQAGFSGFNHLQLEELGFEKGESEVTGATVARVAKKGAELLGKGCCS